jgi:hypothetical protein
VRSDGAGGDARGLDPETRIWIRNPSDQPAHPETDRPSLDHLGREKAGVILTAEEHQIGAIAWRMSNVITSSPVL